MAPQLILMFLLAAADPTSPSVTPSAPGNASQPPFRLVTVETKTGAQPFLVSDKVSLFLSPAMSYELIWNEQLQQGGLIAHGIKSDKVFLVTRGKELQPTLEDLTGALFEEAAKDQNGQYFDVLKVNAPSKFATDGNFQLSFSTDAAKDAAAVPLSVRIGTADQGGTHFLEAVK